MLMSSTCYVGIWYLNVNVKTWVIICFRCPGNEMWMWPRWLTNWLSDCLTWLFDDTEYLEWFRYFVRFGRKVRPIFLGFSDPYKNLRVRTVLALFDTHIIIILLSGNILIFFTLVNEKSYFLAIITRNTEDCNSLLDKCVMYIQAIFIAFVRPT